MNIPTSLRYTKAHLWVKMDGETAIVGITDYAQDALGNIIYINLPGEGDSVTAGESFGDVESEKTTSEMLCPVSVHAAEKSPPEQIFQEKKPIPRTCRHCKVFPAALRRHRHFLPEQNGSYPV